MDVFFIGIVVTLIVVSLIVFFMLITSDDGTKIELEQTKTNLKIAQDHIKALHYSIESKERLRRREIDAALYINKKLEEEKFHLKAELKKYKPKEYCFTENEKIILSSLSSGLQWIARDKDNEIVVYSERPKKIDSSWSVTQTMCMVKHLTAFNHLFKTVVWEDSEPCEFRRYL